MATADIIARLRLNGEQFSREFQTRMTGVETTVAATSRRISRGLNSVAGAFGVTLGVGALVGLSRQALQTADDLEAAAQRAGVGVERYQTLTEAFRVLEVDGDVVERMFRKLLSTMGDVQNGVDNSATQALNRLGIRSRILSGEIRTTDQLLDALGQSSRRAGSGAQYASELAAILGQRLSGVTAAAISNVAEIRRIEQATRDAGIMTEEMSRQLADANEVIDHFTTRAGLRMTIWLAEAIEGWNNLGAAISLALGTATPSPDQQALNMMAAVRRAQAFRDQVPRQIGGQINLQTGAREPRETRIGNRTIVDRPRENPEWARRNADAEQLMAVARDLIAEARRATRAAQEAMNARADRRTRRNGGGDEDDPNAPNRTSAERERLIAFSMPVQGRQTGAFGDRRGNRLHEGLDLAVPVGTAVRASAPGTVIEVGEAPGFGSYVLIDHGKGTTSRVAHLSRISAERGQSVDRGDIVGLSGGARGAPGSGNSRGPHVHYQVEVNGRPVDPRTGNFPGDVMDAQGRADQALGQQRDAQQQILTTMMAQTDQQVEQSRLGMMRAQGLDREADLEGDLAEVRRAAAEQMSRLPETQQRLTNGIAAELATTEQLAGEFARLRASHADRNKLTVEQRTEEERAATAVNESLARANAMKVTAADTLAIDETRVRVAHKISNAIAEGGENAEKLREVSRMAAEEREAAERQLIELKDAAYSREQDTIRDLASFYRDAFEGNIDGLWDRFKNMGLDAIAELAAQWTLAMFTGQQPQGMPGFLSNLLGLAGGKGQAGNDPLAKLAGATANIGAAGGQGAAGGAAGSMAGLTAMVPQLAAAAAAAAVVSEIGNALGIDPKFTSPGGLVSLLIGSIKPARRGSSTLGFDQYGQLGVGSSRGNSASRISASNDAIGSVADMLDRIAEQLGGELSGALSVSLGVRDGNWRGDPTGRGITKTKNGAIDFGEDQEAAIRWAIGEALKDGVISGISDASKAILASGQDLERAIVKAALIEEIPDLLKARLDPVGAALDDLNEKWAKTIAALREGSATAEQMADAQQLYKLELEETIANTASASAGLKAFLDALKMGPSSPYSLRDQEAFAQAALQPFLDKIGAGEGIDQEAYQAAAQTYLDIERALYGSTGQFFEAMDRVMGATSTAIGRIDSAVPIRTAADPFIERTADNTTTMTEQLEQLTQTVVGQGSTLTSILEALRSGAGGFIGGAAGFSGGMVSSA